MRFKKENMCPTRQECGCACVDVLPQSARRVTDLSRALCFKMSIKNGKRETKRECYY